MAPPLILPESASSYFKPIKQIGQGKRAIVLLALLKNKPVDSLSRRALKLITAKHHRHVTKSLLEHLKAIQNDPAHNVVRVFEYAEDMSWYTMLHVRGLTVAHLLANHYLTGLPAYLVFHVLDHVVQGLLHLQSHNLCHTDLQAGEHVVLHTRASAVVAQITLLGYAGIQRCSAVHGREMLAHVVGLARSMTRGEERVPAHFRRHRGGKAFEARDLEDADAFYEMVARWTYDGKQTLATLWEEWGLRNAPLVYYLMDEGMEEELKGWLLRSVVTEEEIAAVVGAGREVV